ncbi:MAG: SSS family solute:Na+ symporter [Bradymonadia bacterium]|jgi:SSS family solute:Na+ symporter
MLTVDYIVFTLYMIGIVGVGLYFARRNEGIEDYYVGGRSIGSGHVGLSIAATDVGGGFSIGLGGLGFTMGLSGSWLLFTGLLGAWLSAVFIIPRVKAIDAAQGMLTYPDFLRWRFGDRVALLAAVISGLGYLGFTGGQMLAGAKLASATLITEAPLGIDPLQFCLWGIAFITIIYTVAGGLKAVIYTDTVQWIVLLIGLALVTVPVVLWGHLGGIAGLRASLPPEFFSLGNIEPITFVNWMITIVPIWLVGMTLYQRMYACEDVKTARRAWFIAGLFEYPVMAFMGVFLGMCARVMFPEVESEMGVPLLIQSALPPVITGIVVASYFSAIMSTADSCLMAASGNVVQDVLRRHVVPKASERTMMRLSRFVTLILGVLAVLIAGHFEKVLEAILFAYSFMVAGLFVPTLAAFFWRGATAAAALWAMTLGGTITVLLQLEVLTVPSAIAIDGLDPSAYGIALSAAVLVIISLVFRRGTES